MKSRKSVLKDDKDINNKIYILKAISIISVVCAHTSYTNSATNNIAIITSKFLSLFGCIGVGIFFIISGYLFANNNDSISIFLKKKFKYIVIPWILTGSIVYLYVSIRKNSVSIVSLINFIIGDGSYLYFLTILMLCYCIFFKVRNNNKILLISIAISMVSNIATSLNFINFINPYLNFFNWSIYFVIGILMIDRFKLVLEFCYKFRGLSFISYTVFAIIAIYSDIEMGYWSILAIPLQISSITGILGICNMKVLNKKVILDCGRDSFAIYLLHMPVAGIIVNIFNKFELYHITLIRPIVVMSVMLFTLKALRYLSYKLDNKLIIKGIGLKY